MQEKSANEFKNITLARRVTQISESHCGPAVVQMLLANIGIPIEQEKIPDLGGAAATIEKDGMRIDQLAYAVHEISPNAEFWLKEDSEMEDLRTIVNKHDFPAAVEWQGVFENLEEELAQEDPDRCGHYSIVTYVDRVQLIIVDPYKDFASQDRIFKIKDFEKRWWDNNVIPLAASHEKVIKRDNRVIFLITPKEATFPVELGMQRV